MIDKTAQKDKVVLIAVDRGIGPSGKESLQELSELADTAGLEVVGEVIQNREQFHPAHYIGSGKITEVKGLLSATEAKGIITDDELTGSQMRNLGKGLDTVIMDRTMLILDIFASRANTAEGKLQVELASLEYQLTHLIGFGIEMSRIGGAGAGGLATRGAGETKLELDRRYIRDRISFLTKELNKLKKNREVLRQRREANEIPIIALCGYTNAGKSTLMNQLTGEDLLAEDKLFATLDTTTREIELPGGSEVLLTDTVGFIEKLPHTVVEAFRATLEELLYADVLLHVVDASNPARENQMEVVYNTLETIGVKDIPILTVFNKMDKEIILPLPTDRKARKIIKTSALEENQKTLLMDIETTLQDIRKKMEVLIPYEDARMIQYIHGHCQILEDSNKEEGMYFKIYASNEAYHRLLPFII